MRAEMLEMTIVGTIDHRVENIAERHSELDSIPSHNSLDELILSLFHAQDRVISKDPIFDFLVCSKLARIQAGSTVLALPVFLAYHVLSHSNQAH